MRSVICDRRGPMPREEDSPAVAEEDTGVPNLFSSDVLAFAGDAQKPVRTVLGPRAAVQPERVWIGAAPPSESEIAAQAAAEAAAEQARKATKAKKTAARTVKANASKEPTVPKPDITPVIEKEINKAAGKDKEQPRASVTLKPVTDQAKPAAAKPAAAKPTAAKPTAKPASPKSAADAKAKPQKADAAAKPKTVAN
jgi:D-alanyl-D-alanine carboxypeptidase